MTWNYNKIAVCFYTYAYNKVIQNIVQICFSGSHFLS